MNTEPESLQNVFDSVFAGISRMREAFTPQLRPREVGTITSIATGIAKVSGLPGVGFDELVTFPGDVLGIARIAAIQAAKRAPELIPLAHPIALTRVAVSFELLRKRSTIVLTARVECRGQTGVEMEALTAAAVGLLTVYDMVKAVDRGMTLTDLRLEEKRGGKSGTFRR